jgi:integrase
MIFSNQSNVHKNKKGNKMQVVIRNEVIYLHFPYNGKYIRRSTGLKATKSNIKYIEDVKIPELQVKMNNKTLFANDGDKVPTVDEYMEKSFTIHNHRRRKFTQDSYKRIYKMHIKDTFGSKKIDSIKVSDINAWQVKLLDKLNPKTVHGIRLVLSGIFMDAYKDDLIKYSPISKADHITLQENENNKSFSIDEIYKILENVDERMKCFFAMGFFTGMRTGELIGLKWSDIDFDKKTIKIERSIRKGVEDLPKTKSSKREIEIIDVLMPYIQKHLTFVKPNATYVFETYKNEPFTSCDKINVFYWRPALKNANIPYIRLYQMRHTFATMMIGNGEDILWVSNMLGHKNSTTTLNVYASYVKRVDKKRGQFLQKNV